MCQNTKYLLKSQENVFLCNFIGMDFVDFDDFDRQLAVVIASNFYCKHILTLI
jgi:hypothetical protein